MKLGIIGNNDVISLVKLKNFRAHSNLEANFTDGMNIIIGDNGVGKTSLIEAIYLSLTGSSWRSNFEAITKQGQNWWRVDVMDGDVEKIVKYDGQKHFEIDNKKHLKLPKKYLRPIVLFEPDDLNLLYGSPSRRRHWLNKLLKETDPEYGATLNKFEKVLKQRNALLKNSAAPDQLFIWDLQFANLAAQIISQRQALINALDKKLPAEYRKIANRRDAISLKYDYDNLNTKQAIINQLQNNFHLESITGSTSIGPQKHDVQFQFRNQPAATSASRGENRSIILALKNLEYQIKKTDQTNPLILLDDIMSELDDDHQTHLLNNFQNSQVIITSVNLPKLNTRANVISLGL